MKAPRLTCGAAARTMIESVRTGLAEQKSLWQKATTAKAAGDLEQAVTIGAHVQRRLENLVAALGGGKG